MILRPVVRPITRPVVRGVMEPAYGSLIAQIRALFAAGEQGAWYDPSDLSTLFQDAGGTTPVTALGQPVGLMLDKSKGLARGPELVTNGDFSAGTTGWSATANASLSVVSGAIRVTNVGPYGRAYQAISTVVGQWYEATATVIGRGSTHGASFQANTSAAGGSATRIANDERVADGPFRIVFRATTTTTYLHLQTNASTGDASYWVEWDNISVRELPGNHASQPTATARPTLQADANGRRYLQFDGVDDFLVTSAIDFTGTDKMTVVAGVRKESDSDSVILESSADSSVFAGTFALFTTPTGVSFRSGGTNKIDSLATPYVAPVSLVISGVGDILGDSAIIRVNGAQAGSSATDQGAGNYGNYPLYIGRRGGATHPFNGRIYSLLIRGALSTQAQIEAAERYANVKTGAY